MATCDVLGRVLTATGRIPEAIDAYERALDLDPQCKITLAIAVDANAAQGLWRKALHEYLMILNDELAAHKVRECVIRCHEALGEFFQARRQREYLHQSLTPEP